MTPGLKAPLSAGPSTFDHSVPPLPREPYAPIDLLATLLAHKLRFQPAERDVVVLSHEISAQSKSAGNEPANQSDEDVYTSSLVVYGTPGESAMSRCVGLPVAFAALQVLDGTDGPRGVQGPTEPVLYNAVLDGLERVGLGMKESVRTESGTSVERTLAAGFNL
jgi:alpha-aminoadipic semialdehyde synthase